MLDSKFLCIQRDVTNIVKSHDNPSHNLDFYNHTMLYSAVETIAIAF